MRAGLTVLCSICLVFSAVARSADASVPPPILAFSTYFSGTGNDTVNGVAIDAGGNVIVVGETTSIDIPTSGPSSHATGGVDGFVAKYSPSGALLWSVYLGGSSDDRPLRVAVDAAGSAYVAGTTHSTDLPTTAGAFQRVYGGGQLDAFVTKVGPDGGIRFSTYLGGNDLELGHSFETDLGIAVGIDGAVFVAGATTSSNFPVTAGAYQTDCLIPCWQQKPFVAKLDPTGSSLLYATYIGAGYATSIAVDAAGNAYVGGRASGAFPRVNPLPLSGDTDDAFAAKLNASGSALLYSSTFGGSGTDTAQAIAVDAHGSAYLTGGAGCRFPTTPGVVQPATLPCFGNPSFVVKLTPAGDQFGYATMLSGPANSTVTKSIAVDTSGRAHVTGFTTSPALPMVQALQPAISGFSDAFIVTFDPTASAIEFSTYAGGTAGEQGNAVAVGAGGTIAIGGSTASTNFPTLSANQPASRGGTCFSFGFPGPCSDGFVYVIGSPDVTPPTISATPSRGPDRNDWYRAPVTISFACADETALASCSDPVLLNSEGAAVPYSGTAVDAAGNSATASGSVKIDLTPPTITYAGNALSYPVDGSVAITCAATDALSGIETTTCGDITGPAYAFGLGAHTICATATDIAGNTATAATTFTVTVSPTSLCNLTSTFVKGSSAYAALTARQRAAVDQLAAAACANVASLDARLTPTARASAIAAYGRAVDVLARLGWLTAEQATTLKTLAAGL